MAAKGGGRKVKEDMLTSSQAGGCNYQQKGHSQMQHGIRLRMTAKLEDLLVNTQHGMQIDGSRLQIMMNTDSNEAKVAICQGRPARHHRTLGSARWCRVRPRGGVCSRPHN